MPPIRRTVSKHARVDPRKYIKEAYNKPDEALVNALDASEEEVEQLWQVERTKMPDWRPTTAVTPLRQAQGWFPYQLRRTGGLNSLRTQIEDEMYPTLMQKMPGSTRRDREKYLFGRNERYILFFTRLAKSGSEIPRCANLVGFAMYKFEKLGEMDALRCYEIHVRQGDRGMKVGRRIMMMLQYIAEESMMQKVVVHSPIGDDAVKNFFVHHARFSHDNSVRSAVPEQGYEILSKLISANKRVVDVEIEEALEDEVREKQKAELEERRQREEAERAEEQRRVENFFKEYIAFDDGNGGIDQERIRAFLQTTNRSPGSASGH